MYYVGVCSWRVVRFVGSEFGVDMYVGRDEKRMLNPVIGMNAVTAMNPIDRLSTDI